MWGRHQILRKGPPVALQQWRNIDHSKPRRLQERVDNWSAENSCTMWVVNEFSHVFFWSKDTVFKGVETFAMTSRIAKPLWTWPSAFQQNLSRICWHMLALSTANASKSTRYFYFFTGNQGKLSDNPPAQPNHRQNWWKLSLERWGHRPGVNPRGKTVVSFWTVEYTVDGGAPFI